MKAVILAGGLGSRLSEETDVKPKPMVEIGGRPLLWHIMKIYSAYGINDFIVCLGHKGYVIKEYFANYYLHHSDITFDIAGNSMNVHRNSVEPWRVTLVDTGGETMTGGRIKRALDYVEDDTFLLTYGDGVADIRVPDLVDFHRREGALATVTAVRPPARFGAMGVEGERVLTFTEKPDNGGGWINGGFFVLSPSIGRYIDGDDSVWEREPLSALAEEGQLACFMHTGFWLGMDTLRDRNQLEQLWGSDRAPWKTW